MNLQIDGSTYLNFMLTGDLSEVSGSKFCDLWTSHAFGKDSH